MKTDRISETSILSELGGRLAQARLDLNMTQEGLAEEAAVSKRTIERLETGKSVQLSNLIRVFDALGLVSHLNQIIPPSVPRPMEMLRHQGKQRRRATGGQVGPSRPWSWTDDKEQP
jgi:transcriptional regulator with XRE-family HTH domain